MVIVHVDDLSPGDEIDLGSGKFRQLALLRPRGPGAVALYFLDSADPVVVSPTSTFYRRSTAAQRSAADPMALLILGRLFVTLYGTAREDRARVQRAAEATFSGPEFKLARLETTNRTVVPPDDFRGFGEATMWEVTAYGERS